MSEIIVDDNAVTRLWLAGYEATQQQPTLQQTQAIEQALNVPESDVAALMLEGLAQAGQDPTSGAAFCLAVQTEIYDNTHEGNELFACAGCNNPAQDCLGCCGKGCTGGDKCSTACTPECEAHDAVCGHGFMNLSQMCVTMFLSAVASWVSCTSSQQACGIGSACDCC
jgi:hypothetical protein